MIKSLWTDEEGLTTVEYALLLALLVVAAIGVWSAFGAKVQSAIGVWSAFGAKVQSSISSSTSAFDTATGTS